MREKGGHVVLGDGLFLHPKIFEKYLPASTSVNGGSHPQGRKNGP